MKKSLLAILAVVVLVAVLSVAVLKSSDDGSRRQGALEEGEAVSLTWRGDWSPEAKYARGSVVSYEGATYVAEAEAGAAETKPGAAPGAGWAPLASEAGLAPAPVLTSPNGSFKIEVKDTGILLSGPTASVLVSADALEIQVSKGVEVSAGSNVVLDAASNVAVSAGATLGIESGGAGFVRSSLLTLGCASGARRVARTGDAVAGSAISGGSSTVLAC